jgi:hypothetical protein
LRDALGACTGLHPVYRRLLAMNLDELDVKVDEELALLLRQQEAVERLAAVPGPDESAGVNHRHRSPKGNRQMCRLLNQVANAVVRPRGIAQLDSPTSWLLS